MRAVTRRTFSRDTAAEVVFVREPRGHQQVAAGLSR